ncbi:phospholipase A2 inhibitor NAI-like isoform X2 [Engystomops pustulosus]|uniref:phospholipase A2 inhibitor NAI-like isoform X2 n=1 Tax=Engystomops pustulosus TaxID=76066 RepID=UPI003AFAA0A5
MKSLFGFLCFLLALVGTGNALSCTSCQSLGVAQPNCTESLTVQCAANEQCSTAYRKTVSGIFVYYDVIRGCSPSEKCNKVGSLTYSGNKMTLGIGCCNSTTCTPDLPQLPTESSSANGVQCGTCASGASTTCNPTANIACSGNENRCVAYTQTGTGTAVIYQGCGTQSLCDLLQFSSSYMWSSLQHNFTCAPSGNALSCTSCQSLGAAQPTCTNSSSVQCAANEQCSTAYRKTASGGAVSYDVIRGCSPLEKCNKVGSLTYSGKKLTLGLGCCNSTTCTPDLPQLPTESSSSNGVQCGTCESGASTTCNPTANIACSGNEKRCVAYTQNGTGKYMGGTSQ